MQINQPFIVISGGDPAIDHKSMTALAMRDYIQTRDKALLAFREGWAPMEFVLKPMSRSDKDYCEMAVTTEDRYKRAFRCSVSEVRNAVIDNGKPCRFAPANEGRMTEAEADVFARVHQIDVGGVAWDRAFLDPRSEPLYALHPWLLARLDRLQFRSVEQTSVEAPSKSGDSERAESSGQGEAPQDGQSA